MQEEKITPMMPHYYPKENIIFGATSSYYYVFSSKLDDMFFYKSKVFILGKAIFESKTKCVTMKMLLSNT